MTPFAGGPRDRLSRAVIAAAVLHLLIRGLALGPSVPVAAVDAILVLLAWGGARTRTWLLVLLPFWLGAVAYESHALLLPLRGAVHVADLHAADRLLFGVNTAAGRVALPMFLQRHTHPVLDLVAGLSYLLYAPLVILAAFWLARRHRSIALHLSWSFLALGLLGIVMYLVFPAAPPWYVARFGDGPAILGTAPSPAGALRFDALVGVGIFKAFYSGSANVFGAMPSIHVAYPALLCAATWRLGPRWRIPTLVFAATVAFAAVYLQHHWVLDVISGVGLAVGVHFTATLVSRPCAARSLPPAQEGVLNGSDERLARG